LQGRRGAGRGLPWGERRAEVAEAVKYWVASRGLVLAGNFRVYSLLPGSSSTSSKYHVKETASLEHFMAVNEVPLVVQNRDIVRAS